MSLLTRQKHHSNVKQLTDPQSHRIINSTYYCTSFACFALYYWMYYCRGVCPNLIHKCIKSVLQSIEEKNLEEQFRDADKK